LLIIGWVFADTALFNKSGSRDNVLAERIAVRFQDFAHAPGLDDLDAMAAHWIQKQLVEIPNASVVSYESATQRPNVQISTAGMIGRKGFAERTGATNVMEGFIYPGDSSDSLQLSLTIVNLESGETYHAFPNITFATSDPMSGIKALASEVRGYWVSKDAHVLSPPSYEAYRAYLKARAVWAEDKTQAEEELHKSMALDSSFIDPHFLLLDLFFNDGRFAQRDSQIAVIKSQFPELTKRQKNMLNYHEADAKGDLVRAYTLYEHEWRIDPRDLFLNTSAMVLASGYVNAFRQTIDLFEMIPVDSLDLINCEYCMVRLRLATVAYVRLGALEQAKSIANRIPSNSGRNICYKALPHIHLNDTTTVFSLLMDAARDSLDDLGLAFSQVAREYALLGRHDLAVICADSSLLLRKHKGYLTDADLYARKFQNALRLMQDWITSYPENAWVQTHAGLLFAYLGKSDQARKQLDILDQIGADDPYDYGATPYAQATILSVLGEYPEALDKLEEAYDAGFTFNYWRYDNDPTLRPLFEEPRFRSLMDPLKREK